MNTLVKICKNDYAPFKKNNNVIIFIEKKTNRIEIYGSVKIMYDFEKSLIKIKKNTMYKSVNLDANNYEDANCQIFKKNVIRSKVINSNNNVNKKIK